MLLHVTDEWLKANDEGKYSGAVFLDLAIKLLTQLTIQSCELLWL